MNLKVWMAYQKVLDAHLKYYIFEMLRIIVMLILISNTSLS